MYHFGTPKKCVFGFWLNPPPKKKIISSCLGFDSALKTIDAQIFFWSVLKKHKKSYWPSKTPFWPFLAVNNIFCVRFKNTDQNNICGFIVFKAKTKEKYENNFFSVFISKTQNALLGGSTDFFLLILFRASSQYL